MFLFLTAVGAAGAGLLYAVGPWPALGARIKNAAGIVAALLIGVALWQAGVAAAWIFPQAWCAAFLLMWASQFEAGSDDLIWVRATTATVLVLLLAQFLR
jgi:hypothetical protein